ncbi:unnamed protein product [Ectocarpus sp. 12 AP-2014]
MSPPPSSSAAAAAALRPAAVEAAGVATPTLLLPTSSSSQDICAGEKQAESRWASTGTVFSECEPCDSESAEPPSSPSPSAVDTRAAVAVAASPLPQLATLPP